MSDKTKIEWSDATWNPVTGCTHAGSPACDNCYARSVAKRLQSMGQKNYVNGFKVTEHPHMLEIPLKWNRPRRIFVVSMGDLFHEDVSDTFITVVFGVMAASPQHTFQVLTKRPKRAKEWFDTLENLSNNRKAHPSVVCMGKLELLLEKSGKHMELGLVPEWPLPNVWIGVTVENQQTADSRIAHLLNTPASVHFLSIEPMMNSIDLQEVSLGGTIRADVLSKRYGPVTGPRPFRRVMPNGIDWVIVGGESRPNARPMHPDWVCSLRDQCKKVNVPFLFKQWGEWYPLNQIHSETKERRKELESLLSRAVIDGRHTYFGCRAVSGPQGLKTGTTQGISPEPIYRIGKSAAGCKLDGALHEEYPEVEAK